MRGWPATQEAQAQVQLDIMYSASTRERLRWYTDDDVAEHRVYGLLGIEGVDESLWDHSILDEVYANGPTA